MTEDSIDYRKKFAWLLSHFDISFATNNEFISLGHPTDDK